MDFLILEDSNRMHQVIKDRDGGCDEFKVTFSTEEEAHRFVIKLLIANGNLPASTIDMDKI